MTETGVAAIPTDVERLVVIAPTWVGDTVMATPVLRAARRHLPSARITVATRAALEPLLLGVPWIDEVVSIRMKGAIGPFRAARELRRRDPDAILLLPNSLRSGLTARLTRARTRVGYDRDGRGPLLTHRLRVEKEKRPTSTVLYYGRLLTFAFGDAEPDLRPELFVTAEEDAKADEILADVAGPFALLAPGGEKVAKRWPVDRFARLADHLHEAHGLAVVASGSPAEGEVIGAVAAAARTTVVDLTRRGVDLGSLKAIARRARVCVTNDTGPRHIAAALGTPLVSLFGPTDHRWTTLDGPIEHIVRAEPFLPEDLVADRHAETCAVDRIPVGDVRFAVSRVLEPPSRPLPEADD